MFNTMIGKYIPFNSKIHNMNSKAKLICLLIFLILLFINDYIVLSLLTILTICLMILSKVSLKLYFKSISGLKTFILFIFIITLIFHESWVLMLTSLLKIILGIIYTMIITYTTSKSEITYGLEQLFKPLEKVKLPVKKIALSITLALRFIPSIFEQTQKIMKSQASRGIDFKYSNLKGKITAISSMVVPMFILTAKKSDRVADSMEVRLYNYKAPRTNYRFSKWTNFDDSMIIIHVSILIIYIAKVLIK